MEEGVLQRVISICRQKSVSESQFAKMIGSNQKTINQQLRGERSISLDTISKILSSFEDVSSEWLLRGEGDMLKPQPTSPYLESKTNKTSAPHQIETKNINIDLQGEQIDSKKTIEVLIKVIETYQTRMDDLLNVVEVLKDENANLKVQLEKTKCKLNK